MSGNAGAPAIVDLDHDGSPDVVATFIFCSSGSSNRRCILSGISGRSGRRLWTYPSDTALADVSFEARHRPAVLVRGHATLIAYVDRTSGWDSIRPPGGCRPGRSGLDSCRFSRFSMRTWRAMENPR